MKRILFLLMILVYLAGCQKENAQLQQTGLLGTWELRHTSGSIAGVNRNFPAGNGNTLTFLDKTHYQSTYSDDNVTTTGSGLYELNETTDCNGKKAVLLSYPPSEYQAAISFSDDTLRIGDNCILDGIYYTYVKIK